MQLLKESSAETPVLSLKLPALCAARADEVAGGTRETNMTLLYLLRTYEREERKREKFVAVYPFLVAASSFTQLAGPLALLFLQLFFPRHYRAIAGEMFASLFFGPFVTGMLASMVVQNWQLGTFSKRPNFSSAVQQNVITELLDHGDVWLTADALARATTFYTGNRDRLYDQLVRALALLPDDPGALSPLAHRALAFCLNLPKAHAEWQTGKLPALQVAIRRYMTRNEIAGLRAKKGRYA